MSNGGGNVDEVAIWGTLEARPGKEPEVEEFLRNAKTVIDEETGTTTFFALKTGPGTYAVFNTFADASALDAHIGGGVGKSVVAEKVGDLFVDFPTIVRSTVLAAKTPGP